MLSQAILNQLQRAQDLYNAGRAGEAWNILVPLRSAINNHGQALRLHALVAKSVEDFYAAAQALIRIMALENEPPEIIGALADLVSRVGKYEEALQLWDTLVRGHPQLADAHLNRAVTATNAGKHDLALSAAEEGLSRFPDHPRLLATKAMALKNVGRISEAVEVFEIAVAAEPDRALTRHNQAVTLRAACRYEEACEAYAASEKLGSKGPQFLSNWAAAALEAGKVDEAAELYERALRQEPGHRISLRALTRLDIEYRGGRHAFDHYRRSAEISDWAVPTIVDWADNLVRNRRVEEAAEVLAEGLRRHPGNTLFEEAVLYTRGMSGDPVPSLDRLEEVLRARPTDRKLRSSVQILAMRAQRFDRSAELLEAQVAENPAHFVAWAQLSIAWRMLDDPREHWLCDYDRLVMTTDVPSPDGACDPEEYARIVSHALDPLHVTSAEPGDQSLRGGTQSSGQLFAKPDPEIQELRQAVLEAARKALAGLSPDPTHPFLSRLSPNLDFSGSWSVRLKAGGHHISHYHPQGWMSSAYYARLPETTPESEERHEGWIQFGVPPTDYGLDLKPRRIVQPRAGRLVLFPSYIWHGTVPFQTGDRLTAAFDYQPV